MENWGDENISALEVGYAACYTEWLVQRANGGGRASRRSRHCRGSRWLMRPCRFFFFEGGRSYSPLPVLAGRRVEQRLPMGHILTTPDTGYKYLVWKRGHAGWREQATQFCLTLSMGAVCYNLYVFVSQGLGHLLGNLFI